MATMAMATMAFAMKGTELNSTSVTKTLPDWSVDNTFSLDLEEVLSHPLIGILNYSSARDHLPVTHRGHPWATLNQKVTHIPHFYWVKNQIEK